MNTVNNDIIKYAEYIDCGRFGENLFFGRVPDSNKTPTALWWIVPTRGYPTRHNVTGEDTILYNYDLSYRNMSLEKVDQELFRITKEVVSSHCYDLDNFHTLNVQLTSVDPRYSVDSEGRVIGTLSFAVTVHNILAQS